MAGIRDGYVGSRLGRREDGPLLAGRAQFVADITLPGMVEAAFVRSSVAHARITGIDLDDARADPAVLDVVTAADLDGVARYPHLVPWMKDVDSFPLARDRVRYVGMPIVAVRRRGSLRRRGRRRTRGRGLRRAAGPGLGGRRRWPTTPRGSTTTGPTTS